MYDKNINFWIMNIDICDMIIKSILVNHLQNV
jgi:hypothetical protein